MEKNPTKTLTLRAPRRGTVPLCPLISSLFIHLRPRRRAVVPPRPSRNWTSLWTQAPRRRSCVVTPVSRWRPARRIVGSPAVTAVTSTLTALKRMSWKLPTKTPITTTSNAALSTSLEETPRPRGCRPCRNRSCSSTKYLNSSVGRNRLNPRRHPALYLDTRLNHIPGLTGILRRPIIISSPSIIRIREDRRLILFLAQPPDRPCHLTRRTPIRRFLLTRRDTKTLLRYIIINNHSRIIFNRSQTTPMKSVKVAPLRTRR